MKKTILRIQKKINGKFMQKFFEDLHSFALHGMGYGEGGDFRDSGEVKVINYIRNKAGKNVTLFDVGANIGNYSLLLKDKFPNSSIFSFEPSKKTFEKLKLNIKDKKNILSVNCGLGAKEETRILYYNYELSGLSSLYKRKWDNYDVDLDKEEKVKIITLDKFCRDKNINHIDFLKIDVEGNEFNVLKGAQDMLSKRRIRFIQFEFGGQDVDAKTFFRDFWTLLNKNYKFYRIFPGGIYPIKDYTEKREIYSAMNYFLELKEKSH